VYLLIFLVISVKIGIMIKEVILMRRSNIAKNRAKMEEEL